MRVPAILIGVMCASSAAAGDVANVLASALQIDDREHSGLRAGGGYWQVSAVFDDLGPAGVAGPARLHGDDRGIYLLVDTPRVLTEWVRLQPDSSPVRPKPAPQTNPIGEYVGAGVVYRSASAQFGIAVGIAELGAPFERALTRSGIGVADREAVYELSWRVELSEGFALQSDVQYIRNPGMDATVDSSWTVGLRFELGAR